MKASESLRVGREFLAANKWGRGDYHDKTAGTYCAVGALYCGVFGPNFWENGGRGIPDYLDKTDIIMEAEKYLNRVATMNIIGFNDHTAKRKRDVLSVYNKAIKLAESESK